MGSTIRNVNLQSAVPVRIRKWKVKKGMRVSARQVVMLYEPMNEKILMKYKVADSGSVRTICAEEDAIVKPGQLLLMLEECSHPTVMADMCAECGADLRETDITTVVASVPMVHSIPELKVSHEQAQTLGKADEARLLGDRKLVLLVDLDQTLIHTTNDNIPPNLKDVVHFQLYGPQSPWYHTRIRPGTDHFLEAVSKLYELHICTFGARNYAHYIAMFLDPDGRFFSHRILSRDECFDANSKTANLKALFPCGDSMVCIIDDREDVWNYAPNLIHVKPYHFFQHTGDINAPPGLTKKENDSVEEGFDFSALGKSKADTEGVSKDVDKKALPFSTSNTKSEGFGDTTTDKDTEDEREIKAVKEQKRSPSILSDESISSVNGKNERNDSINDTDAKNDDTANLDKVSSEKKSSRDEMPLNTANECSQAIENDKKEDKEEESIIASESSTIVKTNEDSANIKEDGEDANLLKKTDKDSKPLENSDGLIVVEDSDDYLFYLEDILNKIHKAYYDEMKTSEEEKPSIPLPDLKMVIPKVKGQILKGCHLVFSGLVPSHVPLQRSRAYMVAQSLGASVNTEVGSGTTHLVAARAGTAKVNSSRRQKGVFIVTPQWLWACAERWEKVDERLFTLARGMVTSRHPPAHCGSPQHPGDSDPPPTTHSTESSRFSDSINPLLTLSIEEVASMDEEVEALIRDDDDDSDTDPELVRDVDVKDVEMATRKPVLPIRDPDESSSSNDSLSGRLPKGWNDDCVKTKKRKIDTTTCTESDLEEDSPSAKFRRGEPLPSDLDLGEDSPDSQGSQDNDADDADWTLMGAALEREFLSGN